ncbi:ATP-binding cassette domain-containing protein [Actinosynnema sp. CA-299493]
MTPLLSVRDLVVRYPVRTGWRTGWTRAVDGVSFDVARGEILGLVGRSGCGKTSTARAVTRLLEPAAGSVRLDGEDVTRAKGRRLREFRARVQVVFQDPYGSLNPRLTVTEIIAEPLIAHGRWRHGGRARVTELLELVGLRARDADAHPHEFSGGQRQRIATARALALDPALLVLDEPLSALDVSVRAQIVNLFTDLRSTSGMSMLFISHDLPVVRHISDRVLVMDRGRIVEHGPTGAVLDSPAHPTTRALVSAVPGRRSAPTSN